MTLADFPSWFSRGAALVFGLLWGSFLNVVIYRVPREMSVVRPGSHCPACRKPVPAYLNVPVFSWLLLRGRAACCGAKMSARYPLVEILGGGLSLAVLFHTQAALGSDAPLWKFAILYLADLAIVLGLVASTFIDLSHMILPDEVTLGGAVLALATVSLRAIGWKEAAIAAAVGFGIIAFVFNGLYKLVRGRTGMGLGDAKLLALAGAWLGGTGCAFVLFAGALQGALGSLAIRAVMGRIELPEEARKEIEELQKLADEGDEEAKEALADDPLAGADEDSFMQAAVPFGPFLILACFEYFFFGDRIRAAFDWYLRM